MTVEEFYEWAIQSGYEHFNIVISTFYGEGDFNPEKDLLADKGRLVFECEC